MSHRRSPLPPAEGTRPPRRVRFVIKCARVIENRLATDRHTKFETGSNGRYVKT